MAVNGNITSLYETPFDGKLMAASKDILDKNKPDDKNPNINSGMLLLNMEELSKTDLLEKDYSFDELKAISDSRSNSFE